MRLHKSAWLALALILVAVPMALIGWISIGAPGGLKAAASFINGKQIGRFERIKLEGITETKDGLNVAKISLLDTKGVWLIVNDLGITWTPKALLARRIDLSRLAAKQTLLLRRPLLRPAKPSKPLPLDVTIRAFETNLQLSAGVFPQIPAVSHHMQGKISLNRDKTFALSLGSRAIAGPSDTIEIEAARLADMPLNVNVMARGGVGGFLNAFIGTPSADQTIVALAITGDVNTGQANGSVVSDGQISARVKANWDLASGQLSGFAAPDAGSWIGGQLARFGGRIDLKAHADAVASSHRIVVLTATAPAIAAGFTGPIDFDRGVAMAGSLLKVERADLALLSQQRISGLASGDFAVEGAFASAQGSLNGILSARNVAGFGVAFARITSPLEIKSTSTRVQVSADAQSQMRVPTDVRLATLGTAPKLSLRLEQDRMASRWILKKAQLSGKGIAANFTGRMGVDERQIEGRANFNDVASLLPILSGQAQVSVNLRQAGTMPWQGKATINGRNLTSTNQIITQLIGNRVVAEITPVASSTGNSVFSWDIKSGNAQARGSLNTQDLVPLQGTWNLKAPLVISGVSIAGTAQAGPAGDLAFGPNGIAIGSGGSRVVIGGWTLDDARFLAVGGVAGKPIVVAVDGIAPLGPANVAGAIVTRDGAISVTGIVARHAGLVATGNARSFGNTFDGLFDLEIQPGAVLKSGASSGKLGIAVRQGRVGIDADLSLTQAVFANVPFQVSNGRVLAQGLLGEMALRFNGDVRAGTQQGRLNLTGRADLDGRDTSLILNGSGTLGGQSLVLTQPIAAVPLGKNARLTGQAIWGEYRLGFDGQIKDSGLNVKFIDLAGPALSARVTGRLGGETSLLRGTARATDLSRLNSRFLGSAQGELTVSGRGAQGWRGQVQGRASNLSMGSPDVDRLLGATPRFDFAAVAMPGRAITGAWALVGKQLSGSGTVVPPTNGKLFDARGVWRLVGPTTLGGADIAGTINGDVALQNGALNVTARSPSLVLAGQSWTDVRAKATIPSLLLASNINIEAAALGGFGPITLNTIIARGNPPSLSPLVVSYGGVVGRGSFLLGERGPTGTLALEGNPGGVMSSGSARGAITLAQGNAGPQIDARLSLSDVSYDQADIAGLSGSLTAIGPLSNLVATLDTRFILRGQAASARLAGRLNQGETKLNLVVSGDGTYQGSVWRLSEPLSVASQNSVTQASGRAVWRLADVSFDGTVGAQRLNLVATLKDAPASLFNKGANRYDGRLSGDVTLRGQGGQLDGEGELFAVGLRPVRSQSREAINGSISATLRSGVLSVRGNAVNPRGLRGTGDVTLPVIATLSPFRLEVSRAGALNGRFEIGGPVEALAKLALSPNSTASGNVIARGQLSGTIAAPSVSGRGELTNAALRDPSLGIRVTDANAVVNFLGPVAEVESFTAGDGRGGKAQLEGRISFARGADWRLAGQLDRFQLVDNAQALIIATGPWSLASAASRVSLGGDLVLNRARVGIPAGTSRSDVLRVREINRPPALGASPTAIDPTQAMDNQTGARNTNDLQLDLKISSRGNAQVVSRGFDGFFDLNLNVKGSLNQPQIDGSADLVRGRFDLAGRSFDVTEGKVRFRNPLGASDLSFTAERETADITAVAKIRGTLGRPIFKLESTPPSPQDEILSRILFGRNVAALSLPQAAQLTLGISSLSNGTQLDPTVRLSQALGLERFSLGTDSGGFAGFTAGLRLVRDVYVEVTTGGEDGTVTMLEWRPRRRIQVQVTTSQKRQSTVSVRLRSKD